MTVTCWSGPGAGQRGPGLAAASTPWVSGLVSDTSQGPPAPPSVLHKAPPQLGGFSGAGSLRRPKLSPSPGLASVFPMGLLQAAWSPPWRQSGPHWGQELGEASSPGSLSVEQTGLAGQREAPGWHGGQTRLTVSGCCSFSNIWPTASHSLTSLRPPGREACMRPGIGLPHPAGVKKLRGHELGLEGVHAGARGSLTALTGHISSSEEPEQKGKELGLQA